ncbi:hypothetical protein SCG7086_CE_00080 [Chlamydiales bacterium SCGC AG-110-P3]|nr:hypothetical protein SCG7086_CE_00080 [Chlamydiales bacterium SCGC AG-110-P3]
MLKGGGTDHLPLERDGSHNVNALSVLNLCHLSKRFDCASVNRSITVSCGKAGRQEGGTNTTVGSDASAAVENINIQVLDMIIEINYCIF